MGPGIGLSFALAGYPVTLSGRTQNRLARAALEVEAATAVMIDHGLLTADEGHDARQRMTWEIGLAAAARSTYVVEAIAEDLALKQDLFIAIERLAPTTALLASTTSALSPTALQQHLQHPERLLVTHYIRPAHLMPMCEVVPGLATSEAIIQQARRALESCGIRALLCRDVPGFVFNRLHLALVREALALLRDGVASLADIEDTIKLGFGSRFPAMGPFEYLDLSGLDLIATVATAVYPHLDCSRDVASGPLADHIAQQRLGMKVGHGFHEWPGESPAEFVRRRDQEIIRRKMILRDELRQGTHRK